MFKLLNTPENQAIQVKTRGAGNSLLSRFRGIFAVVLMAPGIFALMGFSPMPGFGVRTAGLYSVNRISSSNVIMRADSPDDIVGRAMLHEVVKRESSIKPSEAMNLGNRRYAAARTWESYRNALEAKKSLPSEEIVFIQEQAGLLAFSDGHLNVHTEYGDFPVMRLRDFIENSEFTPVNADFLSMYEQEYDIPSNFTGKGSALMAEAMQAESFFEKFLSTNADLSFDECLMRGQSHKLLVAETERPRKYFSAAEYREHIEYFSRHFNLSPRLVYGIMRTESNFNPNAVSTANALGLMQVVPESAGGEVYAYLTGVKGIPSVATLLTPEENIRYGTAYLHLLMTRHFQGVEDPVSRQLCAIAAYNGGSGAVLRIFDTSKGKAIEKMNQLTPGEMYVALTTSMPYAESRNYVVKVLSAMEELPAASGAGVQVELKSDFPAILRANKQNWVAAGSLAALDSENVISVNISTSKRALIKPSNLSMITGMSDMMESLAISFDNLGS